MRPVRVMVVAGETSGERHAAGLLSCLRAALAPRELELVGSGGPSMQSQGVRLLHDVSRLSAIGPLAALANLRGYLHLFRELLQEADRKKPDLAILVDFPDFNLRLAARLRGRGIPVCYFISPQLWAWRRGRVKQIRRHVDLMLVIFPFEEGFFRQHGVEAVYVGNPTASRFGLIPFPGREDGERKRILLLPGSRRKEVDLILPVQLDTVSYLAERMELECRILKAPEIARSVLLEQCRTWVRDRRRDLPPLEILEGSTEEALAEADAAIVKSGTSTLEAMLAGVPFAMVYRMAWTSYFLLRPWVPQGDYCLANLVAGRRVVPEYVQGDADGRRIGECLIPWLTDPEARDGIRARLAEAAETLGRGDAYEKAAAQIKDRFFAERESC